MEISTDLILVAGRFVYFSAKHNWNVCTPETEWKLIPTGWVWKRLLSVWTIERLMAPNLGKAIFLEANEKQENQETINACI